MLTRSSLAHNGANKQTFGNIILPTSKLCERDIISFCDLFLSSGTSIIKVQDIEAARKQLQILIQPIQPYRHIAFLAIHSEACWQGVTDFYQEFCLSLFNVANCESIEEIIQAASSFDCFLIEETEELLSLPWFASFKQELIELSKETPITIISIVSKGI